MTMEPLVNGGVPKVKQCPAYLHLHFVPIFCCCFYSFFLTFFSEYVLSLRFYDFELIFSKKVINFKKTFKIQSISRYFERSSFLKKITL